MELKMNKTLTEEIGIIAKATLKILKEADENLENVMSSKTNRDVDTTVPEDDTEDIPSPDLDKDVKTTDADSKVRPAAPTAPTIKENDLVMIDEGPAKGNPAIVKRVSGDRLSLITFAYIQSVYESKIELENYELENVSLLDKADTNFDYLMKKVASGRPAEKNNFEVKAKKYLKALRESEDSYRVEKINSFEEMQEKCPRKYPWCVNKRRDLFNRYGAPFFVIYKNDKIFALYHQETNKLIDKNENTLDVNVLPSNIVEQIKK